MDYINIMVKNIIFFMVLSNILLNLVNGNEYRKYIRVFCGFLLIILLINPLFELIDFVGGIGDKNTADYLGDVASDIDIEEIEEISVENVKYQYQIEIKSQVNLLLDKENIKYNEVDVYEKEGEYYVSIDLLGQDNSDDKIINLINENLYIPKSNIFIV